MMGEIVILGVFVADTTYRADRQPRIGETIIGQSFALGPGGKGSNQAVAAARAGGRVRFITRLGADAFAVMARAVWSEAGVIADVTEDTESYTGAACIFVDATSADNAIIVAPGAGARISEADIERRRPAIEGARVFVTQLEQPLPAARHALSIARGAGVRTILNPAPAAALDDDLLALCDIVTPNESEAESLTGIAVSSLANAERAAAALLSRGVGAVVVTLGEGGALYHDRFTTRHIPAFRVGPVVETTGAGDAFTGAFAVALGEARDPVSAARFACAAASISVTRSGAASAMPVRADIERLLATQSG
jgi:ribokinase